MHWASHCDHCQSSGAFVYWSPASKIAYPTKRPLNWSSSVWNIVIPVRHSCLRTYSWYCMIMLSLFIGESDECQCFVSICFSRCWMQKVNQERRQKIPVECHYSHLEMLLGVGIVILLIVTDLIVDKWRRLLHQKRYLSLNLHQERRWIPGIL